MNRNLLLLLGGGAVLLWYLDQKVFPQSNQTSAAPGTPAQPAAAKPAAVAPSSDIKAKIEAAILAGGNSNTFIYGQQSPDTWGWFAMQALPGWTAPGPEQLYPGVPDAHKPVTFADWFTRVAPSLPGSTGLSGFVPKSPLFNQLYGGWMA